MIQQTLTHASSCQNHPFRLKLSGRTEFPHEVGASSGQSSRWVRVEESGGTIHGHPITQQEFQKLTEKK
jgi:hypothetical protein